jgi:hypothetical protein
LRSGLFCLFVPGSCARWRAEEAFGGDISDQAKPQRNAIIAAGPLAALRKPGGAGRFSFA